MSPKNVLKRGYSISLLNGKSVSDSSKVKKEIQLRPYFLTEKSSVKSNQPKNNHQNGTKITYTAAFEELQTIVGEIEEGEITVDELSEKVKRAAELIKICKEKLSSTEEDVNKILKEMDGNSAS